MATKKPARGAKKTATKKTTAKRTAPKGRGAATRTAAKGRKVAAKAKTKRSARGKLARKADTGREH